MTYNEKYEIACKNIEMFIKENKDKMDKSEFDAKLTDYYVSKGMDPDGCALVDCNGVTCSADGLISLRRITKYEKIDDYVEVYREFRRVPIIFFPPKKRIVNPLGINCARAKAGYVENNVRKGGFGDRIDQTLFDIKMYYIDKSKCRLLNVYKKAPNRKWLDGFGKGLEGFKNLVLWLMIDDVFVDKNYDVYDLEKSKKAIIKEARDVYTYDWDADGVYYNNLKEKIREYYKKNC